MIKHHKFYTRIDARGLALKLARKLARIRVKENKLGQTLGARKRARKLARKRVKRKNSGRISGARKLARKLARLQIETKYV